MVRYFWFLFDFLSCLTSFYDEPGPSRLSLLYQYVTFRLAIWVITVMAVTGYQCTGDNYHTFTKVRILMFVLILSEPNLRHVIC